MSQTFANTIDNNPIFAARSTADKDGNQIDTTYATKSEAVPASTSSDEGKVLTVDSLGIPGWAVVPSQSTGLFEAVYGTTAYADIAQAITDKKIVYCAVSRRMAFLAYVGIDNVEFQYYRSNPSGDDSVFVYKVTSTNSWTTTERPAGIKTQVKSDWNASSGAAQILNKPTIPSGESLVPAHSSSDSGKVLGVNASGNTEWVAGGSGTQVQADWTESDTSDPSYIQNKPTLATVATSGSYNDLSNTPTIPSATSDLTNDSGFITASDVPAAQVNSDWNASSGAAEILNKPANLVQDASYVHTDNNFTTSLKDKLDGIAAGAEVNVNADWNAVSGDAQILNKPTLATVATSGDYDDLTNKPTIPAAQVNADWSASSGVAQILNKPTLAAVATSGSYNDLSNTPTIPDGVPAVTSSDDGKVLKATYSGGVGSYAWETASGGSNVVWITYQDSSITRQDVIDIYNNAISGTYEYRILKDGLVYRLTAAKASSGGTRYGLTFVSLTDARTGSMWPNVDPNASVCFNRIHLESQDDVSWIVDDSYSVVLTCAFLNGSSPQDTYLQDQIPAGTYEEGEFRILADSSSAYRTTVFRCKSTYTSSTSVYPAEDSTHWERTNLQSALNSQGSSVTVDQTYNSSSTNPQSGTAVAGAISGKQDTISAGNMVSISSNTVGVSTTAGITDIVKVSALPANPVSTVLYLIEES